MSFDAKIDQKIQLPTRLLDNGQNSKDKRHGEAR